MEGRVDRNEILKISPFAHLFSRRDAYCLLHSLTLHKVYGGQQLKALHSAFISPQCVAGVVDRLVAESAPETVDFLHIIADLKQKGLLVADNRSDLSNYVGLFEHGLQQYKIENMYLIPTSGCKLRCNYCIIEGGSTEIAPIHMNMETARKGLEVFTKLTQYASNVSLTFYGGEPLLNPAVVYFSMRYVRQLESTGAFKVPVPMSLLTNGARIDDLTVETVLETKTKVTVSIDGPQEVHDSARVDAAGIASYAKALMGYRKLQEAGANPGV